jgi:DNA invertase Pin-like site-specific DNA recombinase
VAWQHRKLAGILEVSAPGDTIVVSEISRIARSTVGVLTFLQAAASRSVVVVAVRNRLALDDSLHSKITVTVLALAAEIERDLLRERTKAALAARREKGLPLGRPVGSRSPSMLAEKAADIERMLSAKVSKRAIARVLGCSPSTLYAFLRRGSGSSGVAFTQPLFVE